MVLDYIDSWSLLEISCPGSYIFDLHDTYKYRSCIQVNCNFRKNQHNVVMANTKSGKNSNGECCSSMLVVLHLVNGDIVDTKCLPYWCFLGWVVQLLLSVTAENRLIMFRLIGVFACADSGGGGGSGSDPPP